MNADKDKATPRPWRVASYETEIVAGNQYETVVARIGNERMDAQDLTKEDVANRALIVAAINSWDAHRQLAEAAQKAADTFADFERTLGMLGRKPVAEAAHIAGEALRAALAAVDAVEKP